MNWDTILKSEAKKPYFKNIIDFVQKDAKSFTIYPPHKNIFSAFKYTPYDKVKAVIVGMDPYIGVNQAHGLSFSVLPGITIPPSLRNIYKELKSDLNIDPPTHGCLVDWANNGILLLNAIMTVRKGESGSHKDIGWETFTDTIISSLNEKNSPIVFILWGAFARNKKTLITNKIHLVLESAHPSPFSANNGFFGSKPFSKTNEFLIANEIEPINWQIK